MGKKNKILKAAAVAGAVYTISGAAFTGFVLTRAHKHFSKFADWVKGNEPEPPQDTSKTQEKADHIVIKNRTNKPIHGFMIKNPVESNKWAILIHGFNCEPFYMANLAEVYKSADGDMEKITEIMQSLDDPDVADVVGNAEQVAVRYEDDMIVRIIENEPGRSRISAWATALDGTADEVYDLEVRAVTGGEPS